MLAMYGVFILKKKVNITERESNKRNSTVSGAGGTSGITATGERGNSLNMLELPKCPGWKHPAQLGLCPPFDTFNSNVDRSPELFQHILHTKVRRMWLQNVI